MLVSCFFSSRRRHTRSTRDWSSDVCSSDLSCFRPFAEWGTTGRNREARFYSLTAKGRKQLLQEQESWARLTEGVEQIGRAACREGGGGEGGAERDEGEGGGRDGGCW